MTIWTTVRQVVRISIAVLLFCLHRSTTLAASVRYRQGRLQVSSLEKDADQSVLSVQRNFSVAAARQFCHNQTDCVSFGYESAMTRFPPNTITAYFYRHADWHVILPSSDNNEEIRMGPAFVEDPAWHLYVNTTREMDAVPRELQAVLTKLMELNKTCITAVTVSSKTTEDNVKQPPQQHGLLRNNAGSNSGEDITPEQQQEELLLQQQQLCLQQQVALLDALFHIVYPKELKTVAAPYLISTMMKWSASQHLAKDIRIAAITNLLVIADAQETAPLLVQAGVYETMIKIIAERQDNNDNDWEGLPILALDVLSNIAMYQHPQANNWLKEKGAVAFLMEIIESSSKGFPALQSVLALLHLGTPPSSDNQHHFVLPNSIVTELVELLQNSIDGDVVYGILWDLIPGPLSAIQLLIQQQPKEFVSNSNDNDDSGEKKNGSDNEPTAKSMMDSLLDAGLVEQLLRILEEPSSNSNSNSNNNNNCGLVASHTQAVLEILDGLAHRSQRAREMIWMTAHTIKVAHQRLQEYQQPTKLAQELTELVSRHDYFTPENFHASEL